MDFTKQQERLEFVKNQCRNLQNAKHHEDYTMICCPFHNDKNPSGRINHSPLSRSPGFFKCYGCGATAGWNELAPMLGLEPFNQKPTTRYANLIPMEEQEEESKEQLILKPLPRGKYWRSIPTNLLISIGCQLCRVKYEHNLSDKFIYLPVWINNELKGYTKARMRKKEGSLSYINQKGKWVLNYGLFPFDYAISMMNNSTMVLVEGQRDALRLIGMGIPAMCIMGVQNWTDTKSRLLELHGVEHCLIFMDGDPAGIKGAHKVYKSLKKFIKCTVIKLWSIKGSPYLRFKDEEDPSKAASRQGIELWDPGNCPESILLKIKQKYFEE